MRKACTALARFSLAISFVITCAAFASAQNKDEHLVSARAGGVNFVSGDVTFRRAGKSAWQQLATTDELKSGDAVRTGADGRVEVLLNPGSYLRLGKNSEFELTDAALDTLRLKLARGSALVEAAGFDDADFAITFDTAQTQISIVRSGIYRVNADARGITELFVRKGRALVGRERTAVKEGTMARVGAGGNVEVAKFDKDDRDALDTWGKERAEEIARVNRKLQARQLNTSLASYGFGNPFFGSSFAGVWLWADSCYTFMPFVPGWSSPYGFMYPAWMSWPLEARTNCGCQPRHFAFPLLRGFPTTTTATTLAPSANATSNVVKPAKSSNGGGSDYVVKPSPVGGGGSFKPTGDVGRQNVNPPATISPGASASKGTSPRDN
jgi:hypothetical protein